MRGGPRGLGFRGLGFRGLGFRGLGFRVQRRNSSDPQVHTTWQVVKVTADVWVFVLTRPLAFTLGTAPPLINSYGYI